MFYKRSIQKIKQSIGSKQDGGKMDRNREGLSGAAARTGVLKEKWKKKMQVYKKRRWQ